MTHTLPASDTPVLYRNAQDDRGRQAAQFLGDHGISFIEKNIDEDSAAAAQLQRLAGSPQLPVLDWNGTRLADFGQDELIAFLREQNVEFEDS